MEQDTVNYAVMYREKCLEVNCKVNSAVMNKLRNDSFAPLQIIDLRENYVGPKGVLPLLWLLEKNQTVTRVDLSYNGLDNGAVQLLVDVAKKHRGLTSLDISHNNCTQSVAKHLISLVDSNHNILELEVAGNDLFDALQSRLAIALNKNKSLQGVTPQLNTTAAARPTPPSMGGPAIRKIDASKKAAEEAVLSQYTANSSSQSQPAAPNKVKPRPTPPPSASQGHRRMTQQEREEARQNYQRRLKTQSEQLSEFMKPANDTAPSSKARRRLEELQQEQLIADKHVTSDTVCQKAELDHVSKLRKEVNTQRAATCLQPEMPVTEDEMLFDLSLSEGAKALLVTQDKKIHDAEIEQEKAVAMRKKLLSIGDERDMLLQSQATDIEPEQGKSPEPEETEHDAPDEPTEQASDGNAEKSVVKDAMKGADNLARIIQEDEDADKAALPKASQEPEAVSLDIPPGLDANGVRFYELFNKGGSAYNAGKMEDSYQLWTEALEVATICKNREWISIINGNIQALSYQLLTCQGEEYLGQGNLEDALRCLQLARDVAVKARNNAWERAAETSMNTVRRAQFKACYDNAASIFDPLIKKLENSEHVPCHGDKECYFDTEWERLLKLKEALEHWAGALKYASQVTGRGCKDLGDMVEMVVRVAYQYQTNITFSPVDDLRPRHSGQNTHLYTGKQREQLIATWEDIHTTLRSLGSPLWDGIVCSILGNLHHAQFQNKQAEQCFERGIEISSKNGAQLVEASSLTHLARVLVGLARYAEAEKLLWSADKLLTELRYGPDKAHEIYIMQQQSICYDLLQQIMVSQYRYREGLEMAERMRANTHMDRLQDKMRANFNVKTTADHMFSLARSCQSVLVIYSTILRFDWNVDKGEAEALEQLCIWVMPTEGEIKFVLIEVTKEHNQETLEAIVDNLRTALCVDTDTERRGTGKPISNGIIADTPEYAWRHPLQQLYDFLIYPISDFLTVNAGLDFAPHRKVTFVPHGYLHLVPWAALMDNDGKFLVENFNIQVLPSVQILAMCQLNATKLESGGTSSKKLVVVSGSAERHDDLPYPFEDPVADEGSAIADGIGCTLVEGTRDDILAGMKNSRLVHVAAEVLAEYCVGCTWGGFMAQDGVVSSKDVEVMDLSSELVVAPCCNHSKRALLRGGDGIIDMCRAFTCCGTPTVIYSIWSTPHQSTARLLLNFYQRLRKNPDKAICLSQAQREAATTDPYGPASWV